MQRTFQPTSNCNQVASASNYNSHLCDAFVQYLFYPFDWLQRRVVRVIDKL